MSGFFNRIPMIPLMLMDSDEFHLSLNNGTMNTLDAYKKAIKNKYENEKTEDFSDYLLHPSPARLKKMCALVFENRPTITDVRIFKRFFGFNENQDIIQQINCFDTDKFRPLQNFLSKNTDCNQTVSLDLMNGSISKFRTKTLCEVSKYG